MQSPDSCQLCVKGNKAPHLQMPLKASLPFLCISGKRHFESQIQCLFLKQNQCRFSDSLSAFPYVLDLKIKMLTGIATVNLISKICPYLFLYTSKAFISFSSFITAQHLCTNTFLVLCHVHSQRHYLRVFGRQTSTKGSARGSARRGHAGRMLPRPHNTQLDANRLHEIRGKNKSYF